MELTERKKKVLRSVVDLYIRTAEPVGSKAITELPDMKYSSATIRNERAGLTAMGYLEQPHTSAGRIPSAAGYRLYVDELMMDYRLSIDETKSISSAIEEKMQRVDKMVEKVAKLVSQATDLPAISAASRQDVQAVGQRIQHILQTLPNCLRASRKVDNQRTSTDHAHPAAQHGAFRHRHAAGTDRLSDSRGIPFRHRHGGFRCHITPGKTGSARCEYQITLNLVA